MNEINQYTALHALGINGVRVEKGGLVSLTDVEASAWGSDYVTLADAGENNQMSDEQTQAPAEETPATPETPAEPTPSTEPAQDGTAPAEETPAA